MVIIKFMNIFIIKLLYLVYRTTPVEYNFNYSYQLPSVKLPVVKAELCTIHFTFNEPLPVNDLQTLYVVAICPSIKRHIKHINVSENEIWMKWVQNLYIFNCHLG